MRKIVFLHSSSELYGSDKSLLNLVKNLDKKIFDIIVVLPEYGPLYYEMLKIKGIKVIIKELAVLRRKNFSFKGMTRYFLDLIRNIKFINKLIKENEVDIIYTNTSVVFAGGISAKLCKRKSIWHIREIIKNKYERCIVSNIVNMFSDCIIANSKATADAICKKKNKVKVIYNAIEIDDNNEDLIESDEMNIAYREAVATMVDEREIRGKHNNTIVIGMAGRINRWKGQKLFVDMAKIVSQKYKNVKFLIAGDVYKGEDKILEELTDYIDKCELNNNIILLGQVDDMKEFYDNIDIFVLPSIQPEPFGLVVIEAMNNSLPVVATNHGGPVEIIENGFDGFLVDHKEATEMADVINKLIIDKNLRNTIGYNAQKKVKEKFNVSRYTSEISEVLKSI